jgi:prepilin-type N-terminal cleavage/methylation domain-containing protein
MRRDLFNQLRKKSGSFTLVELLVVIAIILILAGLGLFAGEGVMNQAERSRSRAEIQAMAAALESYKADNGIYPAAFTIPTGTNNNYSCASQDGTGGDYQQASQILYQALSGKIYFTDVTFTAPSGKGYMSFNINQLGNTISGSGNTYIQDPFGYSYCYYTGDTPVAPTTTQSHPPYNGTGFYDLWSTGGALYTTTNPTNSWISNWAQ